MKKAMKKVLVTGGAGFIGRHLLQSLHHKGVYTIIIDNLSNSELPDFVLKESGGRCSKKCFEGPNFSFYEIDIRDED
jgi:nucleoside-diphosphate-sugar epimerase